MSRVMGLAKGKCHVDRCDGPCAGGSLGCQARDTPHRQVRSFNNVVETDHGKLTLLIRPLRGFKALKTACATIKGFEVMHAIRKGQATIFNVTRNVRGDARLIERAFGLDAGALSEAVQFVSRQFELDVA